MDKRRMCPHCRAFITTSDRICPYCNTPVGPRAIDLRYPKDILGGFIPHAHFATTMILVINAGMFLATVLYSMKGGNGSAFMDIDGRTLFLFGAKYPEAIVIYHQWWRLITAGFLHGGLWHIAMNSWVLFDVGAQVEENYGVNRLLVIYFLSTVFGFMTSLFFSAHLSVGASAGLSGLIGAMIALGLRERNRRADAMRGMYIRWAIYIVLIGFIIPNIDNAAHIGGMAAGFCTAYLSGTPKLVETWGERFWRAAAYLCVAVTALSFYYAVRWFMEVSQAVS